MGETEEWDIDPNDSFSIIVYRLHGEEEKFEKMDVKNIEEIHPHLVSDNILLIIDTKGHNAYLWVGRAATIHMKFCAARVAPQTRDHWGSMSTMQLHNIEESSEPPEFKSLLRLSNTREKTNPPIV